MKAETSASWVPRTQAVPVVGWRKLPYLVRRTPQRFRERRFWYVQALVLVATAPHYAIESSGDAFSTLESWQVNSLAISLYILPLLYAALNYSWEGALLTGLWAAALTSPSIWFWSRSETHWVTEIGQLLVVLPVGILVAWRVDLEAKQRRRAEKTSASLSLLNEIGESLSHTLDVEQQLPRVLRRLLSGLPLASVWLCLEPESPEGELLIIEGIADGQLPQSTALAQDLHARVALRQRTVNVGDHTLVPLVTEAGILGSLGATVTTGEDLTNEHTELLATVAHQIEVAVENARLYRQRQDSLQSYVRRVTEAQEEERLRIARELHDETAQELVGLVRRLEHLRDIGGDRLTAPIESLLARSRDTLQSVRRFSRDLRPSVLDDLGLLAAIEMVVQDANSWLRTGARLTVRGEARRLDSTTELALFRIAQEALRNVEKHADASSVTVELDFGDEEVRLSVTDDGVGFSPPRAVSDLARVGKLGLLGMKERAELVGGSFAVWASSGKGTHLEVAVARGSRAAG